MDPILKKYATRPVPRYTSYPTAPHFQPDFPETTYRGWLADLDPAEPISLYLHVPFCKQMCWYCGCNMKLAARYEPVQDYVAALRAEIALVAEALPARMKVAHLHWGGGTPTALTPMDLGLVMEDVHDAFEVRGDAELAIESDPRTLSVAMIAEIGHQGFTRASFGVQEFDSKVQAAINRKQPAAMVETAVLGLRTAGVKSVNFDLIYGLPHQTEATLAATVDHCGRIAPDRIALFGYAHVPWMAKNQRMIDEAALPDTMARHTQAETAAAALAATGYQAIGLDHFARADDELAVAARCGRLHRNFQGYTTDAAETMIGFGATSIGRTPTGFVQNISETGAYARAIGHGLLPVAKGRALTRQDRFRGYLIERIMCDDVVDIEAAARAHGLPPMAADDGLDALWEMADDGLVTIDGRILGITPRGRPLRRVVAAAFDAYLPASAARHSVAV